MAREEPRSKSTCTPASHPRNSAPFSLHHHFTRLGTDLSAAIDSSRRFLLGNASNMFHSFPSSRRPFFASTSQSQQHTGIVEAGGKHAFDVALGSKDIAESLSGTSVYTVSNSKNEFVLISDPKNSSKSLSLLCFRQEDARSLLAQVILKQPELGRGARVVPITLDEVYMLKVEGIAFRFLPDPLQIRHALELKSGDESTGFDGVPVFQSDLLSVKGKDRKYSPIYFQKEDIERDLMKFSRASRRSASKNVVVGSLEDVLKKMEINKKDSGWEDLVFIPPGKSYSQHIKEAVA